MAVRLTQREAEVQPPATHNPGFVRRAVALWTDVMIIDLCAVVPRLMVAAGLRLMTATPSTKLFWPWLMARCG